MIRQFVRRATCLVRSLLVSAMLVAISAAVAGAQSKAADEIAARSVVLSLYTVNSMLEQQGAGLEAGGTVMTSFRAFLAPQLIEAIAAGSDGFRPLVGAHEGTVDDYELRMAADQPVEETVIEAAVKSRGAVRLISFAVAGSNDRPLITRIWGDGWSLGKGSVAAMRPASGAPGHPPSQEEQKALAAADRGGTEAGDGRASDAMLPLPYQDEFDGDTLGPDWGVIGEAPDKFVVENGVVYQIATGGDDTFRNEGSENIFRLGKAPEGDFDMTLTGLLEAKTGREGVWLGLYEDSTNFLAGTLHVYTSGCGPYLTLRIVNRQHIAGVEEPLTSEFHDNLFDKGPLLSSYCNAGNREIGDAILQRLNETGFSLTLSRRGILHFATVELDLPAFGDNPGGRVSVTTRKVARTTAAGRPAFMLGQLQRAGNGESVAQFDRFSISAPVN